MSIEAIATAIAVTSSSSVVVDGMTILSYITCKHPLQIYYTL